MLGLRGFEIASKMKLKYKQTDWCDHIDVATPSGHGERIFHSENS